MINDTREPSFEDDPNPPFRRRSSAPSTGRVTRLALESVKSSRPQGTLPLARGVWLRRGALLILASVLGLGAGWWAIGGSWREPASRPSQVPGVLWPHPQPIGAFSLQDHHGRAFTRERLNGVWTFMFFGYTYCPDVCPTTMATLRQIESTISEHATVPRQHVMVSVDPPRDSVERLAQYVPWFGASFIGVTGSEDELSKLARQVGAAYFRGDMRDDGSYLIEHTASVMLIDPWGRLIALFGMPHHADTIVARFLELERQVLASEGTPL